ncbi:MAG TPA: hypothetical protein VFE36_10590, partial [Candidatus Baltobacteraceae bacterium]|nr:hypothetical protein [Candidatus Baltobacteraceae bacterium]
NERDFHETLVGTIRPPFGQYSKGIHTISAAGGVCVIDARRYIFSPWRIGVALRMLSRRKFLRRLAFVPRPGTAGSAASLPTLLDSPAALD